MNTGTYESPGSLRIPSRTVAPGASSNRVSSANAAPKLPEREGCLAIDTRASNVEMAPK